MPLNPHRFPLITHTNTTHLVKPGEFRSPGHAYTDSLNKITLPSIPQGLQACLTGVTSMPHRGYKHASQGLQACLTGVTSMPHRGYKHASPGLQACLTGVTSMPHRGYMHASQGLQACLTVDCHP